MAQIANACIGSKPVDQVPIKIPKKTSFRGLFIGFLMVVLAVVFPVAATPVDINLTWVGTMFTSLVNAVVGILPSVQTLMEAGFPVIIEFVVYGGILAIIVAFIVFGKKILEAVVKMLDGFMKL